MTGGGEDLGGDAKIWVEDLEAASGGRIWRVQGRGFVAAVGRIGGAREGVLWWWALGGRVAEFRSRVRAVEGGGHFVLVALGFIGVGGIGEVAAIFFGLIGSVPLQFGKFGDLPLQFA